MQVGKEIIGMLNKYYQSNTKNSVNEVKPILRNVKVGEELKVELLKIMNNTSLVELSDGTEMVISGTLPKEAEVGMFLKIKIKSKTIGLPTMAEVMSIENAENSKIDEIRKIFKNLKIPMTKQNLEVTREMIKNNVTINEENIAKTFKVMNEFKDVDVKSIIFMLKNDIKVTKESTESFLNLLNQNGFIEANIEDILKLITKEINKLEEVNNTIENKQRKLETLSETTEEENTITANNTNNINESVNNELYNLNNQNADSNLQEETIIKNVNDYLDTTEIISVLNEEPKGIENNIEEKSKNMIDNIKNLLFEKDGVDNKNENTIGTIKELENNNEEIYLNKDSFFKEEKLKQLKNKILEVYEIVEDKEIFKKNINEKNVIKKIFNMIDEVEKESEKLLSNVKKDLEKVISHTKQNIELLSDLNKYNTVLQIPLNMNNNNIMAELYIFNGDKESSKKKINEKNYTMFINLGTANLDKIEAYVKVFNKTVECNFMTTNEFGANCLKENSARLIELLGGYGYQLIKMDVKQFDKATLNIFEAIEKNKEEENKFKFDMKV